MAFLRNLLATLLGLFIFMIFGIFIFAGFIASLSKEEIPQVPEEALLRINLSGAIVEQVAEDPLQDIFPAGSVRLISLIDLLQTIKEAKNDYRIKGIYLKSEFISAGYSTLKEVRDALEDFKNSGKFIYAYGEYLSEGDYYVCSVADSLFINPEGALEFNGLSINITHWKGLFDKIDVQPEIFRVGRFKSYVEPFQQKKMSEENRTQLTELLESIYATTLSDIAKSRNIAVKALKGISDDLKIEKPIDAYTHKLIDGVVYEDEVQDRISKKMGYSSFSKIETISESRYQKSLGGNYSKDKIAVIVAEGDIVMGGDENSIVGEKFAEEIKKARESSSVKAIVLRINSPGGSLTASDMIWREVELTKGVKPIIASMSDVAASGGYYIAMNCDSIIAQPNTITGSIGIFGMMFNLDKFLENKLGITHDVAKTGKYSDMLTITRELTPFEKSVFQRNVERGYETFITKAAAGRRTTPSKINEVGEGRVWTGEQAVTLGLVDRLGSFQEAIEIAAQSAGISDYKVNYYPTKKPLLEQIITRISDETDARIFTSIEKELQVDQLSEMRKLINMQGIQALLPYTIRFE